MYEPKPIKGLKVEYDGQTYDKITHISCSNDSVNFENMPNKNTTIYISCKLNDAKITMEKKKKGD